MAFDNTYEFTSQAIAEGDWNFDDPRGTGVQPNNTAGRWSWHNGSTTSTDVGPDGGQGDAGYVYTEMSSSGVNGDVFNMELDVNHDASTQDISFSYYFGYRGDGNNGTIQLQSNENGAGWVNRGPAETIDQQGIALGSPFVWLQKTVDLTGLISGNSTRFRLVITQGSAGTVWHKDVGIDTVRVVGDDQATPGAGLLLASAEKRQDTAGAEDAGPFAFDRALPWGVVTVALKREDIPGGTKDLSSGLQFKGIKTTGQITVREGATVDGLTLNGDVNLEGATVTTLTNTTITGALDFDTAGTYTLDGGSVGEVTNSSGGSITLNLLSGATVATNTGPDITFSEPKDFTLSGLIPGMEVRIYLFPNATDTMFGAEIDGTENVVGTSFTFTHDREGEQVLIQIIGTTEGVEEQNIVVVLGAVDETLKLDLEAEENT